MSKRSDHEWTYVEFVYGAWTECICGFRPDTEAEFDGHTRKHNISTRADR